MADGDFFHAGHLAHEGGEVVAVQIVAGVDAQAGVDGGLGGFGKTQQLRGLARCTPGAGVGLGVQLNTIRADGFGQRHLGRVGVHEEADAHAQGVGLGDQRA